MKDLNMPDSSSLKNTLGRITVGLCIAQLAGCTNVITPPRNLNAPQNVYLLDYGRHSSLLLPTGNNTPKKQFIEYAYGEWDWYANQKNDSLRTIPTLLWPTTGTLGRNPWTLNEISSATSSSSSPVINPNSNLSTIIARQFNVQEIFTIAVESAQITTLLENLNHRFNARPLDHAPVRNEDYKLYFIPEPKIKYSLFHNCNHEVVGWLRALGCTIQGNGTFAEFKIKPPTTPDNKNTLTAGGPS